MKHKMKGKKGGKQMKQKKIARDVSPYFLFRNYWA